MHLGDDYLPSRSFLPPPPTSTPCKLQYPPACSLTDLLPTCLLSSGSFAWILNKIGAFRWPGGPPLKCPSCPHASLCSGLVYVCRPPFGLVTMFIPEPVEPNFAKDTFLQPDLKMLHQRPLRLVVYETCASGQQP